MQAATAWRCVAHVLMRRLRVPGLGLRHRASGLRLLRPGLVKPELKVALNVMTWTTASVAEQ